MLAELLQAKRISPEAHDLYMLFQVNELGRKCLERMLMDTFMDEPTEKEFGGEGFAFYDGRRSVIRDIRRTILGVQHHIKESLNDKQPAEQPVERRGRKPK